VNLPFNGSPDFDRATYIASVRGWWTWPPATTCSRHGPAAIGCGHRLVEMAYREALVRWR
jgi:hypothetical protein